MILGGLYLEGLRHGGAYFRNFSPSLSKNGKSCKILSLEFLALE